MLKRFLPVILAAVVFLFALAFLQPETTVRVVTAKNDLAVGTVLSDTDLLLRDVPRSQVAVDALLDPAQAIGQSLRSDRITGDVIRESHLGETIALNADERALSVKVNDATGLAGLLRPNDNVGLVIVLFDNEGAYSKVAIENLRVLFVAPEFRRGFQESPRSHESSNGSSTTFDKPTERKTEGSVILAVPAKPVSVTYQFKDTSETREVNPLELLAAPNVADNARVMLYAMPRNTTRTPVSSGLYLPDLKLMPTPTKVGVTGAPGQPTPRPATPTAKP
jgi:pilus assembly protein CpaB